MWDKGSSARFSFAFGVFLNPPSGRGRTRKPKVRRGGRGQRGLRNMAESGAPARPRARPQRAAPGKPLGPREPWGPGPGPREPPKKNRPRESGKEPVRAGGGVQGTHLSASPRHLVLLLGSAVTPAAVGPRRRSALRDGAAPASPRLHGRRCPGRRSERGAFPGGPGAGAAGAHRPAGPGKDGESWGGAEGQRRRLSQPRTEGAGPPRRVGAGPPGRVAPGPPLLGGGEGVSPTGWLPSGRVARNIPCPRQTG